MKRILPATFVAAQLSLLAMPIAHATGVFTMKGTLKAFTEDKVVIDTEKAEYELKKSLLPPNEIAQMKAKKTGDQVQLTVVTNAVISSHPLSTKK